MRKKVEEHDEPQTPADKAGDAAIQAAREAGAENVIVLIYMPDSDYRDSCVAIHLEAEGEDHGYTMATQMMLNALESILSVRGKRLVVMPMMKPFGSDQ